MPQPAAITAADTVASLDKHAFTDLAAVVTSTNCIDYDDAIVALFICSCSVAYDAGDTLRDLRAVKELRLDDGRDTAQSMGKCVFMLTHLISSCVVLAMVRSPCCVHIGNMHAGAATMVMCENGQVLVAVSLLSHETQLWSRASKSMLAVLRPRVCRT